MNDLSYTRYQNARLREEYRKYTLPCGLDVFVFPKKMSVTYALFGTKYGSIHNRFYDEEKQDWVTVPDGIAHFLEHKLFACEDGSDAFERFSDYGADANAYTSFNKTCYLFSCTNRFEDSLRELLQFVTHPYFTEESVASELGIIGEEIRMYDDNPSDRCFYGMLEAMYHTHSIRRNICGSASSISEISADLLYLCYDRFYRLSNMALVVCGDVEYDTVLHIANEVLPSIASGAETKVSDDNATEPPHVLKSYYEQRMQVSKPIFNIGFKDTDIPIEGNKRQKKDAAMAILNEMLFSRAGALYNTLIEKDMISPAFSYGYSITESAAYNSLAGEADDPQAVLSEILSYLQTVSLKEDDFLRGKRVMYAEFVKAFDSTDSIANNLFSFICDESDLLSYADIIDSVTLNDVSELFETAFRKECCALSVVLPLNQVTQINS